MGVYRHKNGEQAITVNGSAHDRRLAAADDWELLTDAGTDQLVPELPAKSASKEQWEAFAMAMGVPSFEADAMTRAELIARFDPDRPPPPPPTVTSSEQES